MREEMRWQAQRELVKRITNIATQLVPEDKGVHLRFINRAEPGWDDLRSEAIEENMTFEPSGNTQIGTKLRDKILQPFIYDVLNRGIPLERPYLIMMITDGCPTAEAENTLKDVVMECGRKLREKGYERQGKVKENIGVAACLMLTSRSGHVPDKSDWQRPGCRQFSENADGR